MLSEIMNKKILNKILRCYKLSFFQDRILKNKSLDKILVRYSFRGHFFSIFFLHFFSLKHKSKSLD